MRKSILYGSSMKSPCSPCAARVFLCFGKFCPVRDWCTKSHFVLPDAAEFSFSGCMKLYGFFTVPRGSGVGALPVAVRWGSCTLPVVGQQWVQLPQLRQNTLPTLFRRVGPCQQLRPLGGDDLVPPIVYFSGLPGPCSHHGAQGGCQLPGRFSCRVV